MKLSLSSVKKWTVVAAALTVLLAAILVSQLFFSKTSAGYEATAWAMGSYVQQTLYGDGAEDTATDVSSAITELENLISWRVADSDIEKTAPPVRNGWN